MRVCSIYLLPVVGLSWDKATQGKDLDEAEWGHSKRLWDAYEYTHTNTVLIVV